MDARAAMLRLARLGLAALVLMAAAAGAAGGDGPPDPFAPDYTDQLLRYSETLAREVDGWLADLRDVPPTYDDPYADFSAAMLGRMRAQDALSAACDRGDREACARAGEALAQMQRDTRGLGAISGIEGAYDRQRELGQEWRQKELYRGSREGGYSASDILQ